MKYLILILSLSLGLSSCGVSKLSRAQRKLDRVKVLAPELVMTDTIVVRDTIVIKEAHYDTVTSIVHMDSVTVFNNERVRLKYIYDTITNEIHHDVLCKEIIKPIETRVEVDRYRDATFMEIAQAEWKHYLIFLLIILLVIFYLKR